MFNPMQVCIGSLESKTQLVSLDFFSNSGPGPGPSNRIRNAAAIGLDFHLHFVQTYYIPSVHIMFYNNSSFTLFRPWRNEQQMPTMMGFSKSSFSTFRSNSDPWGCNPPTRAEHGYVIQLSTSPSTAKDNHMLWINQNKLRIRKLRMGESENLENFGKSWKPEVNARMSFKDLAFFILTFPNWSISQNSNNFLCSSYKQWNLRNVKDGTACNAVFGGAVMVWREDGVFR